MNTASDFDAKLKDHKAKMEEYNDDLRAGFNGLLGDFVNLNDQLSFLQNSPGKVTSDDQASLDSIELKVKVMAEKFAALAALKPPEPPVFVAQPIMPQPLPHN